MGAEMAFLHSSIAIRPHLYCFQEIPSSYFLGFLQRLDVGGANFIARKVTKDKFIDAKF